MPRQAPDHRAREVAALAGRELAVTLEHPFESALYHLIRSADCPIPTVREAFEWYGDEGFAHLLNALQIGKAPLEMVAAGLDLDASVLVPYFYLFFDRSVFRHSLDVLRYIEMLDVSPLARGYYTTAVQQGPEYLLHRFRIGARPATNPEKIIETVANDQYDRFLSHRGQDVTSDVAKEALKWGQAAISSAGAMITHGKTQNRDSAFKRLKIALSVNDETTTMEASGISPSDLAPE